MEIDSEISLAAQIANLQKLAKDILSSSQSNKHPFLLKAISQLEELRDLMNDRELSEYVSFILLS